MAEDPLHPPRHPVDPFNQPIKGVSLWRDAWRRLKKNRMAIVGLTLVMLYSLLSLLAPILPIHSYKHQVLDHQYFPPSLTKTAGELLYEKQENQLMQAAKSEGRGELNEKEKILKWLVKHDVDTVEGVGRAVAEYYTDRKKLMKLVISGKKFEDFA